jgi:hypothetical protein
VRLWDEGFPFSEKRPRGDDFVGETKLASGKGKEGKEDKEFEIRVCIFLSAGEIGFANRVGDAGAPVLTIAVVAERLGS